MRVWTTTGVRHFLSTRFGMAYCRERVRQLWHALGWRWHRRRHCHLKAKPEAQAVFVAELEERLAEWPADRELVFGDEATVRRHPTLTAQWCVGDDIPEVPTGDDHVTGPGYRAVALLTGLPHEHLSPELGKGELAQYLPHLLTCSPRRRFLVSHGRGEQHKGAPIEAIMREAGDRLLLKPQPAYSPELNPQERIWKWLRRVVTHHHGFASLHEPIEAIRHCFRYLAGIKDQVPR